MRVQHMRKGICPRTPENYPHAVSLPSVIHISCRASLTVNLALTTFLLCPLWEMIPPLFKITCSFTFFFLVLWCGWMCCVSFFTFAWLLKVFLRPSQHAFQLTPRALTASSHNIYIWLPLSLITISCPLWSLANGLIFGLFYDSNSL